MKNKRPTLSRHRDSVNYEFTNLVFHNGILPGEWDTLEVETHCGSQSTSYALKTKLHPDSPAYVDFWGTIDPYGPGCTLIIIRLIEFSPEAKESFRWTVTTSRFTTKDMSTNRFKTLEEAMKFMVDEMIRTTKHYDKINKRKTIIWDDDAIKNHDIH